MSVTRILKSFLTIFTVAGIFLALTHVQHVDSQDPNTQKCELCLVLRQLATGLSPTTIIVLASSLVALALLQRTPSYRQIFVFNVRYFSHTALDPPQA